MPLGKARSESRGAVNQNLHRNRRGDAAAAIRHADRVITDFLLEAIAGPCSTTDVTLWRRASALDPFYVIEHSVTRGELPCERTRLQPRGQANLVSANYLRSEDRA